MRYLQIVESVRRQVRAAPATRLTLESAAVDANVSPVRLHQIFAGQRLAPGQWSRDGGLLQ